MADWTQLKNAPKTRAALIELKEADWRYVHEFGGAAPTDHPAAMRVVDLVLAREYDLANDALWSMDTAPREKIWEALELDGLISTESS